LSVAVSARGLRKLYGRGVALDDLTLDVQSGTIAGLVGPDGAGKSTAIRVLSTAVAPTAGTARVGGYDIRTDPERVRSIVGVVPQAFTLYGDLTVRENLDFLATVYGVDLSEARARSASLLASARLVGHERKLAGDLSGGMKRKLAVVSALIHRPSILLLDEPTAGVDPVSRREVWKMLGELASDGITVVVTTAYMDEAERCHTVAVMQSGRVVVVGSPNELRGLVRDAIIVVTGLGVSSAATSIRSLPDVTGIRVVGNQLRVSATSSDGAVVRRIVSAAVEAGVADAVARPVTPSIEDVFLSLRAVGDGSAP